MKLIKITLDPATPLHAVDDFGITLEEAFGSMVIFDGDAKTGVMGVYGPTSDLVAWAAEEMPHVVVTFAEVEV